MSTGFVGAAGKRGGPFELIQTGGGRKKAKNGGGSKT
jgi:hypothetical protein